MLSSGRRLPLVLCLALAASAPSQGPRLVVDGALQDAVWQELAAENLAPSEAGVQWVTTTL